ncbi:MAG: hypothetical protein V7641_3455 [Blastocatellia bacterium]
MIRSSLLCAMIITFAASAHAASAQSGKREFVGTIGASKIRMKLVNTPDEFLGSYLYERVGEDIRLAGAVSGDHTFYLNEFDVNGKATAKFEGRFVTDDWIEGTWSSATTGKKELLFSAWVLDGKGIPAADPNDQFSGEYRRVDQGRFDKDTATLSVWLLKDGRIRVSGDSTWIGNAKTGNVNVGGTDGMAGAQGGKWLFKSGDGEDDCRFTMRFSAGGLTVTDDNARCGGLNVSFDGTYRKTNPPKPRKRA